MLFRSSITTAGQYTLFFRANPYADIQESRTDNNLFSIPITINLQGPDLAIVATASPPAAGFGDSITFSWTVRNIGTAAASGSWYDDLYLSDDPLFDTRDRQLGFSLITNPTPLAVDQSYSRTLAVTLPKLLLRQGTYYLILRSDPGQTQGEISETNNISALPISLTDPGATTPVITLSATPSTGTLEDSASPLIFTFLRSGSLSSALSVRVGLGGTASLGSDYSGITPSPTSPTSPTSAVVTFAAGSNTAKLTVTPLMDADPEPDESVTLTLQAGSVYSIGTTSPVTGLILNDDQVVENLGNTSLLRRSDGRAFVRSGGTTRIVSSPTGALVGANTDDWKMLAAETVAGVNQILLRYRPTRQVQTWTLDANWTWQSSSPLANRNSPEGWAMETNFQLDLTNDAIIGPPVTAMESVEIGRAHV